ncbi:MAG: glycerol-3-phosphate 1-O-acyltransferase PlsY [Firmicutes bacterium]|nr:glycerol-3-phosphate 1-O-acyltransferase PlsY [Bacillota bacterium]
MTHYASLVLCAILGYSLGNLQSGLIIGRLMNNVDLRKHGSGSSGATNALRVLGRRQALLTFLSDCLKGVAAAGFGLLIAGWHGGLVGGAAVVVGHIWPILFGLRGGKGVATSLGVFLLLMPTLALIMLVIAILILVLTKTVSLASMAGALAYFVMALVTAIANRDWYLLAFSVIMVALVLFAHRANMRRIAAGTEGKLSASMFEKKR